MNKKLMLAAALVFGAAGLILAQGAVKAQDATDNGVVTNSDTATAPADNAPAVDNTAADNAAAPADNAAAQ